MLAWPTPLMAQLPIHSILPELLTALRDNRMVVLAAPTGSGKTTGVPLALLEEEWLQGRRILILEPRRLATRMAAGRMAEVLGEEVGERVGYRVRFDSMVSAATRIEVVTEGIVTRRLQSDPELADVGIVIFDEFHERSIHADLALALCLDVMAGLRHDLKLLIMSATLDLQGLTEFLDRPAVVIGHGRSFPVAVHYRPRPVQLRRGEPATSGYNFLRLLDEMTTAMRQAIAHDEGDILAFLPGVEEIRQLAARLAAWPEAKALDILPLYGDLPKAVQDRAVRFVPGAKRRVILATSIAETSLTIEGVRVVIDSGWSRVLRFDPNRGLSRLVTIRVSKAAAEQRRGRAGRLTEGVCYRLWSEGEGHGLAAHSRPEILEADLSSLALDLAAWGVTSPEALRFLDPPPGGHYAGAVALLTLLGGLDQGGRITAWGQRMAQLPVHPRLACMLLAAEAEGGVDTACDLAALLTERDLIARHSGSRTLDLDTRLQVLSAFRARDRRLLGALGGDEGACAKVVSVATQLRRLLSRPGRNHDQYTTGGLLARAYPDRVGQLRPGTHDRYLLANGRGVLLPAADSLAGNPYLVAAHLDAGQTEGRVYLAAAISLAGIRHALAGLITSVSTISWDEAQEAVVGHKQERLLGLVLEERPLRHQEREATRTAMLVGVKKMGILALPWTREARALQARVGSLATWQPDQGWPDISDATLEADLVWLAPYLDGLSRRQHLTRLDLLAILRAMLDWQHLQRLPEEAPTHFQAPSGSRLPIRYTPGEPPVVAVRLQELFGLAETPRIAGGRVPVLLHLLSPAQRPIQITQDLRGFWDTTYPEVKKELKGRYPKHLWPDDPWSARATARAQVLRKG